MSDQDKTKEALIQELIDLRQRVAELEAAPDEDRRGDAQQRFIVDNLPDMLAQVDADSMVQFVSRSVQRYLGYAPQDLIGTPALDQVHPDDIEAVQAAIRTARAERDSSLRMEYRYRHADGHYLWIEAMVTLFYDEAGKFAGAIFSGRDMHARKQMEQTLQMFQYTIDQASDAIFWFNREAGFEYVNAQACKMLGYEYDELMSLCLWDIDPMSPKERWETEWEQFQINRQGGTVHVESVHRHKNGTLIPIDVTAQHLWFGGRELHVAVARDISERKQAEEALRESEERYRGLFDSVPIGLYRTTPEGKIIDANPALVDMLGYPDRDCLLAVNARDLYVNPSDRDKWRASLERDGMVSDYEVELRRFDGTTIWVADSVRAVYDDSQEIVHFEGAIADITERKQAEEALRESEEKFRGLVEGLNEAIFRVTLPEANYEYVSPSAKQVFGYSAEEFMNTPRMIGKIIHPDFVNYHRQRWPELLKGNMPPTYEYKILNPDGKERWIFQSNRGIYDHQGNLVAMESLCRNITERKRAEAALKESEERLRLALEGTTDGIWDWNVQTGQTYLSPRYYTMLGYEPGEFPASYESWRQLIHPDDLEATEQVIQRELDEHSGFAMEFRLKTKQGDWLWVLGRGKVVDLDGEGKAVRMAGSHSDISERKKAEEALRESERLLRESQSIAHLGSYNIDLQTRTSVNSPVLDAIFGIDDSYPKTIDGWIALVHPADRDEMVDYFSDHILRKHRPINKEYRIVRRNDGQTRWVHGLGALQFDGEGNPVRIIGTSQDITERKLAEEALAEKETYLSTITGLAPVILWAIDKNGVFTLSEGKGLEKLGFEPGEAVGQTVADLFRDHPEILQDYQRAFPGGQPSAMHDIGGVIFDSRFSRHENEQGEVIGVVGVSFDITEQKRLEAESRQAEILRADLEKEREIVTLKARFISTVSHEFRTPLAVIQTSTDMLNRYFDKLSDDRRQQLLQQIAQQIAHMTYLIDTTLDISRAQAGKTEFSPAPVDLDAFCRNIFDQIQFSDGEKHRFAFCSNPPPSPVLVDGKLLQRILTNVLWNAVKYTPDEAQITFELDHTAAEVILRITDEGIGIPEEDQERLFEPFHRAANVGEIKGTGLGLAIVKQYVELHGGDITLESQEDQGSTFTISLPMR